MKDSNRADASGIAASRRSTPRNIVRRSTLRGDARMRKQGGAVEGGVVKTVWVLVLTLLITLFALAVAIGVFGLILRVAGHGTGAG